MSWKPIQAFAVVVAVAAISLYTGAQTAHKAAPPKQANAAVVDAMFSVRDFQQAEISPDGKRVAWVESLPGAGGAPSPNSAIYVADLSAPTTKKRITAGDGKVPHEEHDIAWSADSKQLAFFSDAPKAGQLQLFIIPVSIPVPGARPAKGPATHKAASKQEAPTAKQLTHIKGFLSGPGWSPDSKTIALLFTENATRAAGPLVAETPDEGVVSEDFLEQRLTLVDVATAKLRQLSPADTYVYEFDWSPDGKQLAITSAKGNGDDNWYIASLSAIDATSGEMRDVQPKPGMQIANPRWSPDGKTIIFIGGLMSDEPIPGGDVYATDATPGSMKNSMKNSMQILRPIRHQQRHRSRGFQNPREFSSPESTPAKHLLPASPSPVRSTPVWKGPETLAHGEFVPYVSLASDGTTTAVVRETFSNPPEVWAGPVGDWKQITHVNASLKPEWGEAKSLRWTTSIGSVQGWLIYPKDFDPAKKYPLVVYVHGGPAWAYTPNFPSRWNYPFALPERGFFILEPNPRGSYGMGEKFTQANVKDFGYGDFLDIMAGVDKAIQEAPVDPARLGITGWSYGGFMTMWAVTQTNRFGAAVAGAGLSNFLSYYGENKIDQWMIPYFGATVYDDPVVYAKSSPINFIKKAKTPTLIVVGDRDGECPAPQSYEFWHALKTLGVPTEFVIYPNEGHLFANPEHSRDVIDRTAAWFGQYLGGAK